MKKILIFILVCNIFISCKKKEEPLPEPEPLPLQTATVNFKLTVYDSLGQTVSDHSGIKVLLDNNRTATSNANGELSFTEVPFGDYFPNFLRHNYEGPPVKAGVNSSQITFSFPVAQRSVWQAKNFSGQIVTKDSIPISFTLDRAIPAGKTVKVALLFSTENSVGPSNYLSVDFIQAANTTVTNLNIANLSNFKSRLAGLDSNKHFYIKVVPVSYGEYESNLIAKPALLGENLFPPDHWLLTKTWR